MRGTTINWADLTIIPAVFLIPANLSMWPCEDYKAMYDESTKRWMTISICEMLKKRLIFI